MERAVVALPIPSGIEVGGKGRAIFVLVPSDPV
jgi:hypothetical protein